MDYQRIYQDFAKHTRENLIIIRQMQRDQPNYKIYEVTLFLNSLYGLLIFPQEALIKRLPRISTRKLVEWGWPIPYVEQSFTQVPDLRILVSYLRNAFAHGNIEFTTDVNNNIHGIWIWNKVPSEININVAEHINWKAYISIEDLEVITLKITEIWGYK